MINLNYREILRRLVKYIIIVLSVFLSSKSIIQNLKNNEIIFVSLLVGLTYCLLDIMMPSIKLYN